MTPPPNVQAFFELLDTLVQDPDLQRELQNRLMLFIRSNNNLRQELRKEILVEELLQLPARFTVLEQNVAELKSDVSELKSDVSELKSDVSELKAGHVTMESRLTSMEARQDTMQGQLNNLVGTDYERKAVRRSPRLVRRHLNIRNSVVLLAISRQNGREIAQLLDEATAQDNITAAEADELDRADIIMTGQTPQGEPVYVVAEVSVTIGDSDVDRARERANILGRASDDPTYAAVIGVDISDANRERAEAGQVAVIILDD